MAEQKIHAHPQELLDCRDFPIFPPCLDAVMAVYRELWREGLVLALLGFHLGLPVTQLPKLQEAQRRGAIEGVPRTDGIDPQIDRTVGPTKNVLETVSI